MTNPNIPEVPGAAETAFIRYGVDQVANRLLIAIGDNPPLPLVMVPNASRLPEPGSPEWNRAIYVNVGRKTNSTSPPVHRFVEPRWRDDPPRTVIAEAVAPVRKQYFVPAPDKQARPQGFISEAQAQRDNPPLIPTAKASTILDTEHVLPVDDPRTRGFRDLLLNAAFAAAESMRKGWAEEKAARAARKEESSPLRDRVLIDWLGFPKGDSPVQVVMTDIVNFGRGTADFGKMAADLVTGASQVAAEHSRGIAGVAAAAAVLAAGLGLAKPETSAEKAEPVRVELTAVTAYQTADGLVLKVPGAAEKLANDPHVASILAKHLGVQPSQVKVVNDQVVLAGAAGTSERLSSEQIGKAVDTLQPLVDPIKASENPEISGVIQEIPTIEQSDPTTTTGEMPSTTTEPTTTTTNPEQATPVEQLRARVVQEARKYLGIAENPATPNHSPEIDELFQQGLTGKSAEWCASFVSRVLLDAGLPLDGGDKDGHKGPAWQMEFVNSVYKWAQSHGAEIADENAIQNGFIPQGGDLVIYNKEGKLGDGRSGVNHIGIVDHYDQATGWLFLVEGNYNNAVSERRYLMVDKLGEPGSKKELAGFIRLAQLRDPAPATVPEVPATTVAPPTTEAPVQPEAPVTQTPEQRREAALDVLLEELAKGEGGYDSVNTGNAGDTSAAEYKAIFGERKLSQMTIAEIIDLQKRGTIFAVGKWQVIRGVLENAVNALGMDKNRVFDAATQREIIINHFLMGTTEHPKRPKLAAFLRGDEGVTLRAAMNDLGKEWASVPYFFGTDKAGREIYMSYYHGKGNNSAMGGKERYDQLALMLLAIRDASITVSHPDQGQINVPQEGDSL